MCLVAVAPRGGYQLMQLLAHGMMWELIAAVVMPRRRDAGTGGPRAKHHAHVVCVMTCKTWCFLAIYSFHYHLSLI